MFNRNFNAGLLDETPSPYGADIGGYLSHAGLLNRELSASRAAGQPRYLLFCFALIFAFMAAVFLMRLSRWPLLNLFLSFAALRFEFYIFRLLREVIADELEALITGEILLEILPALGLFLFAGLLLLLHLLFLPARRRGEAVSG